MTRRHALLPALALLALALTGCAQTSPYAPSEDVFGDWRLAEASGEVAGDLVVPDGIDARPTLTIDADATGGQTPCNRYQASVNGGIGEFSITPTAVTEAACADSSLMDLEREYLEALASVDAAAVDGDTLTLTGSGIELRFERLGAIAASALLGTEWRLDSLIAGETATTVLGEGRLRLDISGGLDGNAGCRDVAGRFALDGDEVVVSGLAAAAADCPAEFVSQEEHVLAVLGERFTTTIDGDRLTVSADDGLALGYVRAD